RCAQCCRVESGVEAGHSFAVKPEGGVPVMFAGSLTRSFHAFGQNGVVIANIPPDPVSVAVGEVPVSGSPPPTHVPPCTRTQTFLVAESTAHSVRMMPIDCAPMPLDDALFVHTRPPDSHTPALRLVLPTKTGEFKSCDPSETPA